MRCPHCTAHNEPTTQWCHACGGRLTINRQELAAQVSQQILIEREVHTEERIRRFLALAVFLFIVAISAFLYTRYTPPGSVEVAYPFAPEPKPKPLTEEAVRRDRQPTPRAHIPRTRVTFEHSDLYDEAPLLVPTAPESP